MPDFMLEPRVFMFSPVYFLDLLSFLLHVIFLISEHCREAAEVMGAGDDGAGPSPVRAGPPWR